MALVNSRWLKEILILLKYVLSRRFYINYYVHPRYRNNLLKSALLNSRSLKGAQVAIVIQGGIEPKKNFTLETLRIYKKLFPNVEIILSTWPDMTDLAEEITRIGIHLVINDPPQTSGRANINYQIVSTKAGIKKARELQVVYVLKTRTDQRINHPSMLDYFCTLLDCFPLESKDNGKLRGRIVGVSKGTFKYRIFGLSDMLQFGYLEDVERYWNIDLEPPHVNREPSAPALVWRDQYDNPVPEVKLFQSFLKNLGVKMEPTLRGTAQAYSRFFVVVSHRDIDLYWDKYSNNLDWHRDFVDERYELEFLDWLMLYKSDGQLHFDESCADQVISGARIPF
jgi:hypothetical protein